MILQLQHITKKFGALTAVDNVSLEVRAGEILAIAGESGSGKSTVAKLMTGLLRPDQGRIDTTAAVQMVFQDPYASLDPLFTIERILLEAFTRRRDVPSGRRRELMAAMLERVGMGVEAMERFPHEFSGGQRQRIAIARALLAGPSVLILDEPTSALDVLVQQQILDLLRELKRETGLTFVFISHNLRVIRRFSDRIAVMHQGRIVEIEKTETIFGAPRHAYTRALLAAAMEFSNG